MRISFSQNGEDILLWRCFGHKPTGFYVDVGASAPTTHSVTQIFYEAGWSGVNIEPVAERIAELRRARPRDINVHAAAGRECGEIELNRAEGWGGLSSTTTPHPSAHSWSTMVRLTTVSAILEEHGIDAVDFVKIDAEGAELNIISGFDLTRWRPAVVIVEAITPLGQVGNEDVWEPLLVGAGYRLMFFDGLNRFYAAAERADALSHCFSSGANVLDGFAAYGAGGHPLLNATHRDHVFARHLALQMLRALSVETDAHLEAMMSIDTSPSTLNGPPSAIAITHLFERVLARRPDDRELACATEAKETGQEIIRRLLDSQEFVNLRARLAMHDG